MVLEIETRFTHQVGTTLIVQVIGLAFSIVNAAIIARWLGPEGKGTLALALLVPGMLGLFLSVGIGVSNVYFTASRRFPLSTLTANSMVFTILATLIGLAIVTGVLVTGWAEFLVPGVSTRLMLLAMLGLPFGLLNGYFSTILQGLQRIITLNLVYLATGIFGLALTGVFVIVLRLGVFGAVIASLGTGTIGLCILAALLRREGGFFKPKWERSVMHSTLSFGLKGHIGNVLQFFNYRLDMFIVNLFLGPGGVGIYSVSVSLAELLWNLPNAVGFVIFPKAAATKPEVMNNFTPRAFWVTLGLTALGAGGLAMAGRQLINIVYSSAFVQAYAPMLVLLPGVVMLGGAKVLTNEIAGRGYPHYNSINAGLALILTVVFDLMLIPRYGVTGAALASSIAYGAILFTAIGFYAIASRKSLQKIVLTAFPPAT
jgi:O-antigen/teichoic acid export membrane protein